MHSSLVLLTALLAGALAVVDYSGYKVLRATPHNEESVVFLNALNDKFDLWKESRGVGRSADILVAPRDAHWLSDKLEQMGIEIQTMIEDVQPLIDAQKTPSTSGSFDYGVYHSLEEITAWMKDFTDTYQSAVLEDVAVTYEGRNIQKIKLSSDLTDTNRPVIFMIGGTHAREWVTPATMMYIADQLATNPSLLGNVEYHIVPVFNQDGYKFSWTEDRMWRKTRSPSSNRCTGTDPNRNYDCEWGTGGSSSLPCTDTYMGKSAASEIEIRGMQEHIMEHKDRVKVFMDVHAYSQLWMYPYGYTKILPADDDDLRAASQVAVTAIKGEHGMDFEYGPIARVIYVASGSSADYAYKQASIKHSYALELRDTGEYGFLLPAEQIIPAAEEFFAGVRALIKHLEDNGEL